MFVCVAVPISFWDVAQHLRHWYDPPLQKCIVRIIWMVPVYAIDSWLALRFVNINIYIGAMRECYEAYVIYNFYLYLLMYLRKVPTFDSSLAGRPVQPHIFPFQWVKYALLAPLICSYKYQLYNFYCYRSAALFLKTIFNIFTTYLY